MVIVFTVLVKAGSRYQVDYPSGVAHFLTKMAVQSTEKFEDKDHILSTLDQYGGIIDCQGFR